MEGAADYGGLGGVTPGLLSLARRGLVVREGEAEERGQLGSVRSAEFCGAVHESRNSRLWNASLASKLIVRKFASADGFPQLFGDFVGHVGDGEHA